MAKKYAACHFEHVKVWKWLDNAQKYFSWEKLSVLCARVEHWKGQPNWSKRKNRFWPTHFIVVALPIPRGFGQVFLIKHAVTPSKCKLCLAESFTCNSACPLCLKTWLFTLVGFFRQPMAVTFHLDCNLKNMVHMWLQLQDLQTFWSSNLHVGC